MSMLYPLQYSHPGADDMTSVSSMDIDVEGVGHIVRSNMSFGEGAVGAGEDALTETFAAVSLLEDNSFGPAKIRSVKLNVTLRNLRAQASVDSISLPKTVYEPGELVTAQVVIRPFNSKAELKTVSIRIPQNCPDGHVTLIVRGGDGSSLDGIYALAGLPTISAFGGQESPKSLTLKQAVQQYLNAPTNDELLTSLGFTDPSLGTQAYGVQGVKLTDVPPAIANVLRRRHSTDIESLQNTITTREHVPYVLDGGSSITIQVARKNLLENAAHNQGAPSGQPNIPGLPGAEAPGMPSDGQDGNDATLGSSMTPAPDAFGTGADQAGSSSLTPMAVTPSVVISAEAAMAAALATIEQNGPQNGGGEPGQPAPPPAKAPFIARQMQTWIQNSTDGFAKGHGDGTAVSTAGDVRLLPQIKQIATSAGVDIWSLAADGKKTYFAGSGDTGEVYKWDGSKLSPYASTNDLLVTALAFDKNSGVLYAGSSPKGQVVRIQPNGKVEKIFNVDEDYVTALAVDPSHSRLYIAAGGGAARIFTASLANPLDAKLLFTSTASHINALAVDAKGTVYAAGSLGGAVYAISPDGRARVVFTVDDGAVTSLAVGKDNAVYVGSSPTGWLYKLTNLAGDGLVVSKKLNDKPLGPIAALAT
jgi:sugar lactone lactonase YvrE